MKSRSSRPALAAVLLMILPVLPLPGQTEHNPTPLPRLVAGGGATITTGDGEKSTLAETARAIWASHDRMISLLKAAPRGAIFGTPQSKEEFFEDADVFVAVRTTRVVVKDSRTLAARDPALAGYLGLTTKAEKLTVNQLDPASRKGLEEYLRTEIPRLPTDHPLRLAAASGADALLDAIARGEGEIDVTDTLSVPRVAGSVIRSALDQTATPLLRTETGGLFLSARPLFPTLPSTPPLAHLERRVPQPPEGRVLFSTNMLAGFTRDNQWTWSRRWGFPSGFFRLTLGGRFALGLRVPLQIGGKFSPTRRIDGGARDTGFTAGLELRPNTLDADETFFRSVGVAPEKVHDGKEFVLNAAVLFGYKLHALWTDVSVRQNRWHGYTFDQHFDPPFGSGERGLNVDIPVDVTQTRIGGTGLSGWAQTGLRVSTKGQISLDAQPLLNGTPAGDSLRLSFPDGTPRSVEMRYPALPAGQTSGNFGFRVNNPAYQLSARITPQIRFGVEVGYRAISKTFRSDWIPLNALTVNLPEVRLEGHAGTHREFTYNGGTREFVVGASPAATPSPGRPTGPIEAPARKEEIHLISSQSGLAVRAGVGSGSHLATSSSTIAAWEKFDLIKLADDSILLRSRQNGKYVRSERGPDGLLAASVRDQADAEKFRLQPQPDGTVAVFSPARSLYVRAGIGENSLLGVVSRTVGAWEKFRLNAPTHSPPHARKIPTPPPEPAPNLRPVPTPPRLLSPRPTATPSSQRTAKPLPFAPLFKKQNPD